MFADESFFFVWITISTLGVICFSENVPPSWGFSLQRVILVFSFAKAGSVVRTSVPSSRLTLLCWWLTVQQLCDLRSSESAGCVACCWAADVTACLGSDLLSEAAENKSLALIRTSHYHIYIGNWLFFSLLFSVFSLPADHEGEKTPVNQLSEEELPDYLM